MTCKKDVIIKSPAAKAGLCADVFTHRFNYGLEDRRGHIPSESHVLPHVALVLVIEREPSWEFFSEADMIKGVAKINFGVPLFTLQTDGVKNVREIYLRWSEELVNLSGIHG